MTVPMFRDIQKDMQVSYMRTLASHYLALLDDPDMPLKGNCSRLGLKESTLSDHWTALEKYFGQDLFEKNKRGRTGRLTPFGQMAGTLAAHFWCYDYLMRNGGQLADLGDFWVDAFKADTVRMVGFAREVVSMIKDPVEVVRADHLADDEYPQS